MVSAMSAWSDIRAFMGRRCGVVLGEDQHYLLEARLGPVARRLAFSSVVELVRTVVLPGAPVPLTRAVIDALTTHETSFFRDPSCWAALETTVIPHLLRQRVEPSLRIWCAACSTGQEPYSLAMLLEERWPTVAERTKIVATDVSELSLETAREGRYTALEVSRGLDARRLKRHFREEGTSYRVADSLRSRILWRPGNLLADPPPATCDLVLCRNVLIYFSPEDRERVVKKLRSALQAGGWLGIGSTELLKAEATAPSFYTRAALAGYGL